MKERGGAATAFCAFCSVLSMLLEAINVAKKSVQNVMGSSLALLLRLHFDAGRRGVCWSKGLFPLGCCDHKVCCNIAPCFLLAEGTVTLHWKAASALNKLINRVRNSGNTCSYEEKGQMLLQTSREN
jgi:hypothetical protein